MLGNSKLNGKRERKSRREQQETSRVKVKGKVNVHLHMAKRENKGNCWITTASLSTRTGFFRLFSRNATTTWGRREAVRGQPCENGKDESTRTRRLSSQKNCYGVYIWCRIIIRTIYTHTLSLSQNTFNCMKAIAARITNRKVVLRGASSGTSL